MDKLPRPSWNSNAPHKYGVITFGEAAMLDSLCNKIKSEFGYLSLLEIGMAGGATMAGIMERCSEIGCPCNYHGVDGEGGKPEFKPENATYYIGDSAEVFTNVSGQFNLLFIDGCHCVNHCMLDFLNYSPMVVVGGYCLFHDTNDTIWQGDHYQGHGPKHPEFHIGVRAALRKLGLLAGLRKDWRLVAEVKDTEIMGMMLFRKTL